MNQRFFIIRQGRGPNAQAVQFQETLWRAPQNANLACRMPLLRMRPSLFREKVLGFLALCDDLAERSALTN